MLHDNEISAFGEKVGFSPLAALTEKILKTMCMGPRRGGFILFQAPPSHSCTLGYLCNQKMGKLLLTLVLEDH